MYPGLSGLYSECIYFPQSILKPQKMAQESQEPDRMSYADNHVESGALGAGQTLPTDADLEQGRNQSKIMRIYSHPWTQILLISMICFCLPGVSNKDQR